MDYTRKKKTYRATVALLLLLTVMPYFFVKAFHVHKESSCISSDEAHHAHHHHHDAEACSICLFSLSLFTEAENFEYRHILTVEPYVYLLQKEKDVTVTLFLHSLRAPPACLS